MSFYEELIEDLRKDYKKRFPDCSPEELRDVHIRFYYERAIGTMTFPDPLADSKEAWQGILEIGSSPEINPAESFLDSIRKYSRPKDEGIIKAVEKKLFYWLMIRLNVHFLELMGIVEKIRQGEDFYHIEYRRKSDGGQRTLHVPKPRLMKIQTLINTKLFDNFPRHPSAHGFSGGKLLDALRPHLEFGSFMKLDIKNAFGSIFRNDVQQALTDKQVVQVLKGPQKKVFGYFSWYTANVICDLCTTPFLPQGAPTSPKLFDLAFYPIDKELEKVMMLAEGQYSRYADNLYFSISFSRFPEELKSKILTIIKGERRAGPKLVWHKFWITNKRHIALRALGLNMVERKLYNTRAYKRRFRKALHHTQKQMELGLNTKSAWSKVNGLMGFIIKETLPQKLLNKYKEIKNNLH